MVEEHHIARGVYALEEDGVYHPQLLCVCGKSKMRGCENWSDAGESFDWHLEQVKGKVYGD